MDSKFDKQRTRQAKPAGFLQEKISHKAVALPSIVMYNYSVKIRAKARNTEVDSHVQCYDRNFEGKSPEDRLY